MLVVAAGSLLPSVEDWFGARRELRTIQPLLDELGRRHPDVGIGVRPRGPLVFRVAERMSLISDALFLEATAADARTRHPVDAGRRVGTTATGPRLDRDRRPGVAAGAAGGAGARDRGVDLRRPRRTDADAQRACSPVSSWLRQPTTYSDREWILAIAKQYRAAGPGGCRSRVLIDGRRLLRRVPQCGAPRANRRGAPCDAARRPSGRCPAAPRRTGRPSVPQYGGHPRHACLASHVSSLSSFS